MSCKQLKEIRSDSNYAFFRSFRKSKSSQAERRQYSQSKELPSASPSSSSTSELKVDNYNFLCMSYMLENDSNVMEECLVVLLC